MQTFSIDLTKFLKEFGIIEKKEIAEFENFSNFFFNSMAGDGFSISSQNELESQVKALVAAWAYLKQQ
jgi:hypothetical protein